VKTREQAVAEGLGTPFRPVGALAYTEMGSDYYRNTLGRMVFDRLGASLRVVFNAVGISN
jgi:hypothetical protein